MALLGAWWVSTVASAALLLRISVVARGSLARQYPWFTVLLAVGLARSAALHWLTAGPGSNDYARIWLSSEPLLFALRAAAAIEAYRHLAARYAQMGWLAFGIPLAAGAAAAALVWASWGTPALAPAYAALVSLARASWAILAAAFALSWWLLDLVPAPPSRPVVRHAALFLAYTLSQAAPFAALHLGGKAWAGPMGTAALAAAIALQLAWCFLLQAPAAPASPAQVVPASRHRAAAGELLEFVRKMGRG